MSNLTNTKQGGAIPLLPMAIVYSIVCTIVGTIVGTIVEIIVGWTASSGKNLYVFITIIKKINYKKIEEFNSYFFKKNNCITCKETAACLHSIVFGFLLLFQKTFG